jgi:hypothetical protein
MTGIDVAKKTMTEGAHLFRPRKQGQGYDCKPLFTGSNNGWMVLDHYSAGAIIAVWNALSDEQRKRIEDLPIQKMAILAFRLINKYGI